MKRFKTQKKKKRILIIIIFILFMVLFSLLSFITLNKDLAHNILIFWDKNEFSSIKSINNNLDKFINLYSFKTKKPSFSNKTVTLFLDGNRDLILLLQNNLKKLGLNSEINANFLCKIEKGNDNNIIHIKNKSYAKINLFLPSKYQKFSTIIQKKYSDIISIIEDDNTFLIEVGGLENKLEDLNNSTEIVALILYDIFGD